MSEVLIKVLIVVVAIIMIAFFVNYVGGLSERATNYQKQEFLCRQKTLTVDYLNCVERAKLGSDNVVVPEEGVFVSARDNFINTFTRNQIKIDNQQTSDIQDLVEYLKQIIDTDNDLTKRIEVLEKKL